MVKETKKRKRGPDDEAIEHSVKTERETMKATQQICAANYDKAAERIMQRRMRTGEKIVKLAIKHRVASENYVENIASQVHQHRESLNATDRALHKIEREIVKGKDALKLFGDKMKEVTSYVTKINKEAK